MKLIKTNCTECGSPIEIADDVQYIRCPACSTFYAIERSEGYINLKAIEKLTKAIQDTGLGTQDAIRESTQVTRAELQRLQISQEISMAEMKLGNLQAEIRGLERAEKSPKIQKQISNLHGIEFYTLEELYRKRLTVAALGPQDINSRLHTAEDHFNWLNTQRNLLSQTDFSAAQKQQFNRDLDIRIVHVSKKLFDLRTEIVKNDLPSFKIAALPTDDLNKAQDFVQLLNEDETRVRRMPSSPETQAILKDLGERKKKVLDTWKQLENTRILQALRSPGQMINQNEIASLQSQLALVNQDLNTIGQMPKNTVVKEYEHRLVDQQQSILNQIRRLEKDARKAEDRAAKAALNASKNTIEPSTATKVAGAGCLAGFFLALTGMFAGIAALFKEIFASISARKQPLTQNVVSQVSTRGAVLAEAAIPMPGIAGDMEQAAIPESPVIPTDLNIPTYQPRQSGLQFGAVLKGCSLGAILLIGFFIVGAILMSTAFPDYTTTGSSAGIGALFLATGLGFALGSWVFIRNIAPLTRIRIVGKNNELVINKNAKKPGLNNLSAVKGLVGLTTCLIVYFLFLALAAILPGDSAVWAVCPGALIGPIIGALVSRQTYLGELELGRI